MAVGTKFKFGNGSIDAIVRNLFRATGGQRRYIYTYIYIEKIKNSAKRTYIFCDYSCSCIFARNLRIEDIYTYAEGNIHDC